MSSPPALSVEQRYDFNNRLSQLQLLIESDSAPDSLKKVPQLSKDQQRILLRKYMHREIFTVHQGPAELPANPDNVTFKETYLVHRDYKQRSKSMYVPRSEPIIRSPVDDDEIQILAERRFERPQSEVSDASNYSSYSENASDRDFEPPLSPQKSPERLDLRQQYHQGQQEHQEQQQYHQSQQQYSQQQYQQQHHQNQHTQLSQNNHSRDSSATSNTLSIPKRGRKQKRTPKPDLRPRSKSDGGALAASMVRLTPEENLLTYPSRETSVDVFSSPIPHSAFDKIPTLPPPMEFERSRARAKELKQKQTDEFVLDEEEKLENSTLPKSITMPSMPALPSMPSLPYTMTKRHTMPVQTPQATAADIFEIPAVPAAKEKAEKLSLFKRLAHRRRSMVEKSPPPFSVDDTLNLSVPAIPVSARKMTSEPEDSPLVANRLSSITRPKTRPAIQPRAKSMYVPRETSQESLEGSYPFQARGNELSKHIHDLSNAPWSIPAIPQLSPDRFVAKRTETAGSLSSLEELKRTNTVANGGHILDVGIPPKVPTHRSLTLLSQTSSGTSSDDYFSVGSISPELSHAQLHPGPITSTPSSSRHCTDIYTRKCSYRRPKLQTRKTEPAISVATVVEVESPPVSPEDDASYEQEIEEEIAARQFMLGGYKKSSTKLQVVNWQKDAFMNSCTTLGDLSSRVGSDHSPAAPPLPSYMSQKQQPRKWHKKGGSDAFSFEEKLEKPEPKQRHSMPQVSAAQQTYLDLINNDDMWNDQGNDYFNFGK
ncbi:hypothetical protein CKK34_0728 [Yarrowia sp. E02]|nr:hypothetical protein CKK34_0728 [Yarrowia sp. E02]